MQGAIYEEVAEYLGLRDYLDAPGAMQKLREERRYPPGAIMCMLALVVTLLFS